MTSEGVAAYLRRLGMPEALPPPTLEALRELHRRHVATLPWENLQIMLGRPPAVGPASSLARIGARGRAGYCFHHNGALGRVLLALGFAVERRHGHVWFADEHRYDPELTHLALVVSGLPDEGHPEGTWWADVGLGDAFREPLALRSGEHEQGGFRYRMEVAGPDRWTFFHDPAAHSFTGLEVTSGPADGAVVEAAHDVLSTPPDGPFTRVLVVQRHDVEGIDSLKCCRLLRVEPGGVRETILTSYDAWRAALESPLGLPLDDVPEQDLRDLYSRMWATHLAWEEAGRP